MDSYAGGSTLGGAKSGTNLRRCDADGGGMGRLNAMWAGSIDVADGDSSRCSRAPMGQRSGFRMRMVLVKVLVMVVAVQM